MASSSVEPATSEGLRLLAEGSRLLGKASVAVAAEGPSPAVERDLRKSLGVLRSAMNWLEDSPEFEVAHQRIDAAGKLAREHFSLGCGLSFEDGEYFQECPVALAHNRVGLSMGYIVREAECSICQQDPEDCDHITGHFYGDERCIRIIKQLDLLEVSLVGRPAQPDARITRMSIPLSDIRAKLGNRVVGGTRIICDRCLTSCSGVRRPFESANP